MIELGYRIDFSKDPRSLEAFNANNLTKGETANCIHFLEKVKLNLLDRDFELGEGGMEIGLPDEPHP